MAATVTLFISTSFKVPLRSIDDGFVSLFYLIDQGPPEGWRGPEDNFEDGPWQDDERGPYPPGDSPMRGRGKPRGGRRGRGVRR